MTRAEIAAELRRSALDDLYPFWDVHGDAFAESIGWKAGYTEPFMELSDDGQRTFFLLVAEAL